MEEDLQDWEILDSSSVNSSLMEDISDPESLILPDYFQLPSDSVVESKQELDFGKRSNQVTDEDFGGENGSVSEEIDEEISENQEIGVNSEEIHLDSNEDGLEKEKGRDDEVAETLEAKGKEEIDGGELIGNGGLRPVDQGERGSIIWWKVPVEILKFCVFRVSPVWSVSLAAAIMGVLILRRRLSRMKQKSRSIPIKLTVEDKKVSQFTTRAIRANETFSVVRRVPIFRPLLPSAGVTQWSVPNLR